MGFFSWKTSDTNKSISNTYSKRGALPVYLITPSNEKIYESDYEGYGVFNGYDAFALLAQWNAPEKCNGDVKHDRLIGIDIGYGNELNAKLKYPLKFAENKYINYDELAPAETCPDQGYFYKDDPFKIGTERNFNYKLPNYGDKICITIENNEGIPLFKTHLVRINCGYVIDIYDGTEELLIDTNTLWDDDLI